MSRSTEAVRHGKVMDSANDVLSTLGVLVCGVLLLGLLIQLGPLIGTMIGLSLMVGGALIVCLPFPCTACFGFVIFLMGFLCMKL